MGQARRRKVEIENLKRHRPRGISDAAIHEAGHVVARYWTAELMGIAPEKAVTVVEMHDIDSAPRLIGPDGTLYIREATTYGPMFSSEIETASKDTGKLFGLDRTKGVGSRCNLVAMVKAGRSAGADIDAWAAAKVLQDVAGPAAEAWARRVHFADVMAGPSAGTDLTDARLIADLSGWTSHKLVRCMWNGGEYMNRLFSGPVFWSALLAVARVLPREGSVEGSLCWNVFSEGIRDCSTMTLTAARATTIATAPLEWELPEIHSSRDRYPAAW